ncbi:MAG: transglutaminase-like cysteine peptidase, partial [Desulfobulbaceae bacterium]|nr:transglutaminase-like cysteine peptidase [Candidatus Desulfobia pelagia]
MPKSQYKKNTPYFLLALLFAFLVVAAPVFTGEKFSISKEILEASEEKYGRDARLRLISWENVILEDTSATDREKIEKVNHFFNQLEFVSDSVHWGENDYWATPIEFLGSGGGDCEDFSLSKYFTLLAMGISEKKLNLTYVKALKLNQHHMVLTYFSMPDEEPLVLDNLTDLVLPASQRMDLLPIYSFNGIGLWLSKQRGQGRL